MSVDPVEDADYYGDKLEKEEEEYYDDEYEEAEERGTIQGAT